MGLSRQKVNYPLRVLERVGLVELVELRQRRGCIERILRATAEAFVVDPSVMGGPSGPLIARDAFAAEHLVAVAGRTVRDVSLMHASVGAQAKRLLTFTIETEASFASRRRSMSSPMRSLRRSQKSPNASPQPVVAGTEW